MDKPVESARERPLIEVGRPAPPFSLADQNGETHALKTYAGTPLVLYFYPKDDTVGCTDEACQFRDALPRFRKADVAVLGVSPDDRASHERFAAKHRLSFPILSDVTHEVCQAYGVWVPKSMFGRDSMGVARTTYLIGADGRVARRWDDVSIPGHAEEVFEAVRALATSDAPSIEPKPTTSARPKRRR